MNFVISLNGGMKTVDSDSWFLRLYYSGMGPKLLRQNIRADDKYRLIGSNAILHITLASLAWLVFLGCHTPEKYDIKMQDEEWPVGDCERFLYCCYPVGSRAYDMKQ